MRVGLEFDVKDRVSVRVRVSDRARVRVKQGVLHTFPCGRGLDTLFEHSIVRETTPMALFLGKFCINTIWKDQESVRELAWELFSRYITSCGVGGEGVERWSVGIGFLSVGCRL